MSRSRVIGLDKLIEGLRKRATLDDVKDVVKLNTSEMHRKAQGWAPVDTGELMRSIEQDLNNGGLVGHINATADYASYVEYGTRFYPHGSPFIRPAYHTQKALFMKDIRRLVE